MQLHLEATKSFNPLVFFLKILAFLFQGTYFPSKGYKNQEKMPKMMNALLLGVHKKTKKEE